MAGGYKIKKVLFHRDAILPRQYQEVEYIETTGTQWINTGIYPSSNIQVETKIDANTTDQNAPVFGIYINNTSSYEGGYYYHITCYQNKWYWGINGSERNGGTYFNTIGYQYNIIYNDSNSRVIVNGKDLGSSSGTQGYSGTVLSISRRGDNRTGNMFYGKYKYYYFKMYDKSTSAYVRNMIPCYRKSDGVIGMYDLVGNQFYTNAGSGTFGKGKNITHDIIVYPDKKRKPNANTIAYYPLTSISTVNDMSGNGNTLTNTGAIFGQQQGVDCAYFPNSSVGDNNKGLYTTSFGLQTNMTMSVWFNIISFPNTYCATFLFGETRRYVYGSWINSSGDVYLGAWGTPETIVQGLGTYTDGWHHLCVTKEGSNSNLYIDKHLILTSSSIASSISQRFNIGAEPVDESDMYGYLSNMIVENKVWSFDDISNYYDTTKNNYGL